METLDAMESQSHGKWSPHSIMFDGLQWKKQCCVSIVRGHREGLQATSVHLSPGPYRTEDTDWIGSWPAVTRSLAEIAALRKLLPQTTLSSVEDSTAGKLFRRIKFPKINFAL